jgi:hypothetical protein
VKCPARHGSTHSIDMRNKGLCRIRGLHVHTATQYCRRLVLHQRNGNDGFQLEVEQFGAKKLQRVVQIQRI